MLEELRDKIKEILLTEVKNIIMRHERITW